MQQVNFKRSGWRKPLCSALFALIMLGQSTASHAQLRDFDLPSLGEDSGASISVDLERRLGEAWIRSYYRQSPLYRDVLIQNYIEQLVKRLVPFSMLDRTDLKVLVVDNPSLNAFAVPGGVIGVHTGLLLRAQTEDEFASVIAHEMAHLSQRHFARGVDEQRAGSVGMLAGLLASVVLAATTGGDAALAMMSVSQGVAMESALRYSRQNEVEADRIGQDTLARAGMDPQGTVRMFDQMLELTRFAGNLAPEYLLSHPLPQSRIVDAETRASRYPRRIYGANPDFPFYTTRIQVKASETPEIAERNWSAKVRFEPDSLTHQYGYALALAGTRKFDEALEIARALENRFPERLIFQHLLADVLLRSGQPQAAWDYLQTLTPSTSGQHVIAMLKVDVLNRLNRFEEAAVILTQQSQSRPGDPLVWYELAETWGLAGNIYQLHLARAEYFLIVGHFSQSTEHLRLAKRELGDSPIEQSVLDERIRQVERIRASQPEL